MNDQAWYESVKAGEDAGWERVWEKVIVPECKSVKNAEMMKRFSLTDGDLMGMLYEDMLSRKKIDLFRGEGSFQGWLRSYVRGYILNADPNTHGEISIEQAHPDGEGEGAALPLPTEDNSLLRGEAWRLTHYCLRELWNEDPDRAYIHVLKTRFFLTSEEIKDFLELSSAANVDQIFSRSVKFMRARWIEHDSVKKGSGASEA